MDGGGGLQEDLYQGEETRGGIHQPHYGTWVADLILRQDAGSFMLGRYLSDKKCGAACCSVVQRVAAC